MSGMTSPGRLVAAVMAGYMALYWSQVAVRTLTKPEVEYPEPFTLVDGVRELRDGRLVVVDPRDKIVQLVDMKSGSAVKIGREGGGPGEYGLPQGALALPGDSTLVPDVLNRRSLVILPNGKPGGFLDMPPNEGSRGGMMMLGNLPRRADLKGGLYLSTPGFKMTEAGPQVSDSAAVLRWRPAEKRLDTLAKLALPKNNSQVSGSAGRMNVRIGAANPFAARDEFAVAPDGRVAVVRVADYHVEWVLPNGQHVTGAPIRYDRLKLSEAHKQEWRESRKNQFGLMMENVNGRMSATMAPVPKDVPDPGDWPEYLPPFTADAAVAAPDGRLWVRRTGPAGAPTTYDVIDANGKLAEKVVLPKRTRLVGFGSRAVYLVRTDEDDLQYLGRYVVK